jgi:hypothetical protein
LHFSFAPYSLKVSTAAHFPYQDSYYLAFHLLEPFKYSNMHWSNLLASFPLLGRFAPLEDTALEQRQDLYPDHGFKGINWREVDKEQVCSKAEKDILLQTVFNVDLMANDLNDHARVDHPAWERFMGGRWKDGVPQPKFTWFVSASFHQSPLPWAISCAY